MELIVGIIVGVIALTFLVVVHELGHAIAARRNGVVVEEFGIGFPPKVWGKKLKNKVLFSINALPLGGFVKLQGEYDSASKKGDYGAATFWVKTKILLAGVLINWLTAVVLLTILALTGLPKILPDQFTVPSDTKTDSTPVVIASVGGGSPAEKAGLKRGDAIIRFAGEPVPTTNALLEATKDHKGKKVEVIYERGGSEQKTEVTLKPNNNDGQGFLGVGPNQQEVMRATWSAPIVGVALTGQLTGATFAGLGTLAANVVTGVVSQFSTNEQAREQGNKELQTAGSSVAGPIGILGILFPAAQQAGFGTVIFITALISLTLAVMNILPIPALDGGRWFTMVVFRLLKKPLTREREEKIQAAGFLSLMALVVVVTVLDVTKIIK